MGADNVIRPWALWGPPISCAASFVKAKGDYIEWTCVSIGWIRESHGILAVAAVVPFLGQMVGAERESGVLHNRKLRAGLEFCPVCALKDVVPR